MAHHVSIGRRDFLASGVAALAAGALARDINQSGVGESSHVGATHSVVPVVGDGRWIWNQPPKQDTGYLELRSFKLKIGIELEGTGNTDQAQSTTPVPIAYPEQEIESRQIETNGCVAQVQKLNDGAAQLQMLATGLGKGKIATAYVHDRVILSKQYHRFSAERFPVEQTVPADVRRVALQDSPGIETRAKSVRELADELVRGSEHPWDRARAFCTWVRQNIEPQLGPYTSVSTALQTRRGDCEEMAGVFIALCRAVEIPARLVWVPNHAWAEFYLVDHDRQGHWIPAHTACYPWFGFTGAHELVLQKGDRVAVPLRTRQLRLMDDWLRWSGAKPRVRYTAELTPEPPSEGADAGPGARQKDERGDWKLVGNYATDKYVRR